MAQDPRPALLCAQDRQVRNKLPKSQQSKAKRALQEVWMAETKKDTLAAFDVFVETWGACLIKDHEDHTSGSSCLSRMSGPP